MDFKNLEIEAGLFSHGSPFSYKAFIKLEELEDFEVNLLSERFFSQETFLSNLFKPDEIKTSITGLKEECENTLENVSIGTDRIVLKNWKNVSNISARLVEVLSDTIILECLIDKENKIYEEREFQSKLFEGYELKVGSLFLLRLFERQNEMKLQVYNDPELTLVDDFPKLEYYKSFKDSKLFKQK